MMRSTEAILLVVLSFLNVVNLSFGTFVASEGLIARQLASAMEIFAKGGRPVFNSEETIRIGVAITIMEPPVLDEVEKSFNVSAMVEFSWHDPYADWADGNLTEVTSMTVEPAKIKMWRPQVIHLENFENPNIVDSLGEDSPLDITQNGTVKWKVGGLFSSRCDLVLYTYPFDVNQCTLTLASEHPNLVAFDTLSVSKSESFDDPTNQNNHFRLIELTSKMNQNEGSFRVDFKIGRRSAYHIVAVLAPCVFTAACQLTTFLLPLHKSVRSVHSAVLLVAFGIFLLAMLQEALPKTTQTMLLTMYIMVQMAFSVAYTLHSVAMNFLASPNNFYGTPSSDSNTNNLAGREGLIKDEPVTVLAIREDYRLRLGNRITMLNIVDQIAFALLGLGNVCFHIAFYFKIKPNNN